MITITQDTLAGRAVLNLQFDESQCVLFAHGLCEGSEREEAVVAWLVSWLPGKPLLSAQEEVGEELLLQHPSWGLSEARLVESLLRDAVYRTHRKVEVSGVIVCRCKKVTRETLREAIELTPTMSREELTCQTQAGSGCGQCIHDLEELLQQAKPQVRRWHGEPNSYWVLQVQDSLNRWCERNSNWPQLTVTQFQEGVVRIRVAAHLTADQEWDLLQLLADYLAEGFPSRLDIFLDFSIA